MEAVLSEIRRYPVKSMGGESLDTAMVDERGLVGDRWYAVRDVEDRLASGKDTRRFRRRDRVFDHRAHTGSDGAVAVTDGHTTWPVGSPELDSHLAELMGADVRVAAESDVPHQDAGAVSLVGTATLQWCEDRWGIDADPRRLRVNLVVETREPFVEEAWIDRGFAMGSVGLAGVARITRCRMIDLDQDGARASGRWLRPLAAARDTKVAIYADVVGPGRVTVGDPVVMTG